MHPRDRLRALAAGQDGQFAVGQAFDAGLTRKGLRCLAAGGEIANLRPGVWRFRSTPGPPDPAVTACLACWPDGVISHRSAARQHGLRRVPTPDAPDITLPHDVRRSPAGITIHRSRALPAVDVVTIGSVRYTSVARTVCDLSEPDDPWEALALLADAIAGGAPLRWINQRAAALANGRTGVALIRDATLPGAANVFRSWLERAAGHVYRTAGIPDPAWNVEVSDEAGLIGIVDALWLPWRVVSEKEGLRFHTAPAQRRTDAARFNRLREAGYEPRRFTWEDVVHRPVEVAATVIRALRSAGADLDPARIPRHIALPDRPFL